MGLKVTFIKEFGANNSCAIKEIRSTLNEEIKFKILRKAALMKKEKDDKDPTRIIKK